MVFNSSYLKKNSVRLCRFCVVIWFFHPRHNANDLRLRRINFYPRLYPLHFVLSYFCKKGISLFNFQCQTRELLAPLLYRLWYDAVLDWGLNPGHPSLFWFRFWRYLTRELTWHLSQSYGPQLILVPLWNHTRIRAWNQPTMSNEGKVYCSKDLMDDVMYCYVR